MPGIHRLQEGEKLLAALQNLGEALGYDAEREYASQDARATLADDP